MSVKNIKKLNEGGEELRTQGQLLHINQGLESQYIKSINYIDTISSVVYNRKYSKYRELKRKYILNERNNPGSESQRPSPPSNKWKFDFHNFISNLSYRNAWIDIYGGIINEDMFLSDDVYRGEILKTTGVKNSDSYRNFAKGRDVEEEFIYKYLPSLNGAIKHNVISKLLEESKQNLTPAKIFFNILDTMQIPHYMSYLESADMLHQEMMKTSVKYRTIYTLGKRAIDLIGAYSSNDKENVLKRVEQFVDRTIRNRFFIQSKYIIRVPEGHPYFIEEDKKLVKTIAKSDTLIQLGTRAGNASFKMLMETKIIPDLQQGKIGGNRKDGFILHNEFIKSLTPVMYSQNPEYTTTINVAPGINMSPRSDTDKALFEQIKYDFNQLKMSNVRYQIGMNKYDLIELFWIYNQIAFDGRVGESTLTSIFTDLLDYKIIKQYRDFINYFDNNNDLQESVSINDVLREVALKANLWNTNFNIFYYEDPKTGNLSYWNRAQKIDPNIARDYDITINQIQQEE